MQGIVVGLYMGVCVYVEDAFECSRTEEDENEKEKRCRFVSVWIEIKISLTNAKSVRPLFSIECPYVTRYFPFSQRTNE